MGVYLERVTPVELRPGEDDLFFLYSVPPYDVVHTLPRVLIFDFAPADAVVTLAHRAFFGAEFDLDYNFPFVGARFCHGAEEFGLKQVTMGKMASTLMGDTLLDYTQREFRKFKSENVGKKLRAIFALRIIDAAHPGEGRRDSDRFDAEAWRADKRDLCLRLFYALYLPGGTTRDGRTVESSMEVKMQSDVMVVPAAELERLLAAPVERWVPDGWARTR